MSHLWLLKRVCEISVSIGPQLLDLGDVLYAPTTFRDERGRCMMVAWLQELRKGGAWDYAGCLSVPRVLSLQGVFKCLVLSLYSGKHPCR